MKKITLLLFSMIAIMGCSSGNGDDESGILQANEYGIIVKTADPSKEITYEYMILNGSTEVFKGTLIGDGTTVIVFPVDVNKLGAKSITVRLTTANPDGIRPFAISKSGDRYYVDSNRDGAFNLSEANPMIYNSTGDYFETEIVLEAPSGFWRKQE